MSKKIDVSLIPRYKGTSAIEYEKIESTIRKTRLYKFICVSYSQPLLAPFAFFVNMTAFFTMGTANSPAINCNLAPFAFFVNMTAI